jgi:uncharacterized membrane protein (GlpM family)
MTIFFPVALSLVHPEKIQSTDIAAIIDKIIPFLIILISCYFFTALC